MAQQEAAPHTQLQQTHPARIQTHTAPRRLRQSNTQRAAFTSAWRQAERWKWEESGKWAERLLHTLHASAGTFLSYWHTLICDMFYPKRCILVGYATMSSSFHLFSLKLKRPLGVWMTDDGDWIQIKRKHQQKLSKYFAVLCLCGGQDRDPQESKKGKWTQE